MKLKSGDPGAKYARVYLNGVRQMNCLEFDQEAGTMLRLKKGSDGNNVYTTDGDVVAELVTGKIQIEFVNVPVDEVEAIAKYHNLKPGPLKVENDPT